EDRELFQDLPRTVTVWHSHCDEVKELPDGFQCTASSETCAIQAMQHETKQLFGVQFHPELFDETHQAGKKILQNFLAA
ncbi:MAG: gamma-glutamyl-gamma-aminobutyrate hydrolase family protein, partial [Acidobacteriota bacterium]|nr:gamma-glutamyl-gamma-aminobutyrate hydrolase family protein [Acidobacteriota bacterium]